MIRILLVSFLLSISLKGFGQKKAEEYVQNHLVSIKNISPDSTDYSDLEAIGAAIGTSRIVMLGEQSHGDGATMLAKSRLIKYLHEKKGFNVLAFEADFFALNAGWGNVTKNSGAIKDFFRKNLHGVWPSNKQCSELFYSYIPTTYQTKTPLEVSGFDSQIGYHFSNSNLKDSIDFYLRRNRHTFTKTNRYHNEFLPNIERLKNWVGKDKESREWMIGLALTIDTVLAQLGQQYSKDFTYLALENAREFANQLYVYEKSVSSYNIRDAQMARNLQWLADSKYPNGKIIVWAANSHIMKNADTALKAKRDASINWMGTIFNKNSRNSATTYVIGFNSRDGQYANNSGTKVMPVGKPFKDGFETWIDDSVSYGFIDWKKFRALQPNYSETFKMKSRQMYSTGNWSDVFDGIFYIRDMTPVEKLK
ncbi:erythromycin esterase family protein [Rufibacter roseolus]|uniref:erythromycin esterase family protein n=1 Tax=Rufibacter roseolus TaxID=2817375 RepID=UPI001B311645|nr:erythromycin esterase family protein [Rufibacter roseolus]